MKKGPPYEVMHSNAVFFFDRTARRAWSPPTPAIRAAMAEDVKRLLQ